MADDFLVIHPSSKEQSVAWALPMADDFLEEPLKYMINKKVAWALPMADDFLAIKEIH